MTFFYKRQKGVFLMRQSWQICLVLRNILPIPISGQIPKKNCLSEDLDLPPPIRSYDIVD